MGYSSDKVRLKQLTWGTLKRQRSLCAHSKRTNPLTSCTCHIIATTYMRHVCAHCDSLLLARLRFLGTALSCSINNERSASIKIPTTLLHRIRISEVGLLVIFDLTILKNKLRYRIIDTYPSNSLSKVEATCGLKILVSNVLERVRAFGHGFHYMLSRF